MWREQKFFENIIEAINISFNPKLVVDFAELMMIFNTTPSSEDRLSEDHIKIIAHNYSNAED